MLLHGMQGWETTLHSFSLLFIAVMAGFVAYGILFHILDRLSKTGFFLVDPRLVYRWKAPGRLMLPLLMILLIAPFLSFNDNIQNVLKHIFSLLMIATIAWTLANTTLALRDMILSRYDTVVKDNLKARVVHTQINVLTKILLVMVVVLAIALILMTFDRIRQVGMSILASAGIIGIIAGIAAQRSIASLIAGIQIAISQPIRIDDVVIVEGEWGIIEDITLTYVVIRIWDMRRLVVPIMYFLEKPFQNWTRVSSDLLGTVHIFTDYTVPVEKVRHELERLLAVSDHWDKQAWGLDVVNLSERSVELRAMMSAENAQKMWNLRCEIREKLLAFLKAEFPEALPRIRAEVSAPVSLEIGSQPERNSKSPVDIHGAPV